MADQWRRPDIAEVAQENWATSRPKMEQEVNLLAIDRKVAQAEYNDALQQGMDTSNPQELARLKALADEADLKWITKRDELTNTDALPATEYVKQRMMGGMMAGRPGVFKDPAKARQVADQFIGGSLLTPDPKTAQTSGWQNFGGGLVNGLVDLARPIDWLPGSDWAARQLTGHDRFIPALPDVQGTGGVLGYLTSFAAPQTWALKGLGAIEKVPKAAQALKAALGGGAGLLERAPGWLKGSKLAAQGLRAGAERPGQVAQGLYGAVRNPGDVMSRQGEVANPEAAYSDAYRYGVGLPMLAASGAVGWGMNFRSPWTFAGGNAGLNLVDSLNEYEMPTGWAGTQWPTFSGPAAALGIGIPSVMAVLNRKGFRAPATSPTGRQPAPPPTPLSPVDPRLTELRQAALANTPEIPRHRALATALGAAADRSPFQTADDVLQHVEWYDQPRMARDPNTGEGFLIYGQFADTPQGDELSRAVGRYILKDNAGNLDFSLKGATGGTTEFLERLYPYGEDTVVLGPEERLEGPWGGGISAKLDGTIPVQVISKIPGRPPSHYRVIDPNAHTSDLVPKERLTEMPEWKAPGPPAVPRANVRPMRPLTGEGAPDPLELIDQDALRRRGIAQSLLSMDTPDPVINHQRTRPDITVEPVTPLGMPPHTPGTPPSDVASAGFSPEQLALLRQMMSQQAQKMRMAVSHDPTQLSLWSALEGR